MILLDTHAWIWWVSNPESLSDTARSSIDDAAPTMDIYVSSMSVWELAMLVAKDRVKLSVELSVWIAACESLPSLNFVPIDNRIAVKSVILPGSFHSDPADRMIVATALILNFMSQRTIKSMLTKM